MVKLFSLKSPDEWATTKQACRDTYVVTCFLPSTIRIIPLRIFGSNNKAKADGAAQMTKTNKSNEQQAF